MLMIPAQANDPESSFTMSPRSTTRPLYFWNCGSNSAFFKWQMSSVMQNELSRPSPLLHRSPLSYFWLSSGSKPKISPISPIPCPLLLREFSLLEASEWICALDCSDLMNSYCNTIFVISVRSSFHSDSHRFVSFDNTSVPVLRRHRCWHRNFCLTFYLNSSSSGSIVKFWFLDSQFLLLFTFGCIRHVFPHFWPQLVRPGCRLFLVCFPPDHVFPSGGFSFNVGNFVNPVHVSDNWRCPSTFQYSPIFFSSIASSDVWVFPATSKNISGMGHDSSLGTYSLSQMKSPVIDQKSFLASASSSVESSWCGVGDEIPSDSPRRISCSSPWSGRSRIKVDVLRSWSPPEIFKPFLCIEPSGVEFRCVHLLQFFNVRDQSVSFLDSRRV